MAGPTGYTSPSSGGGASGSTVGGYVTYVNSTWVAASDYPSSASEPVIRYATDPTGTWSTATALPAGPGTHVNGRNVLGPVLYVGGTYYVCVRYLKALGSSDKYTYRIYSTTSLSGSWTTTDPGVNDYCEWNSLDYINGEFVLSGCEIWNTATSNPWPGIIAHCSTVGGTWTKETDSTSGLSGTTQDRILGVKYVDGTYYRLLWRGPVNPSGGANPFLVRIEYSSSLTAGSWTAYSTISTGTPCGTFRTVAGTTYWGHHSGTWVVLIDGIPNYTTDLTGSWSTSTLPSGCPYAASYAVGNGWIGIAGYINTSGSTGSERMAYGTSWGGTFSTATESFAGSAVWAANLGYGNKRFVGMSDVGSLNVSNEVSVYPPTVTYLRQRQSPKRAPSRVRGVDLRQRQSPRITG